MEYRRIIPLKDGRACLMRNGTEQDGQAAWDCFQLTHGQTDWLLTYPEENSFTPAQEAQFLREKTASENEIELVAEVEGRIVGLAGIERIGSKEKVKRRAAFGISVEQAYWGQGIGRALLRACIECARAAGYAQLELDVVADNRRAVALYESEGFVEYGRNPRGFYSRRAGWQPLALMRLELDELRKGERKMATICGANCEGCGFQAQCRGCEATCGRPFGGNCVAAEYILANGKEAYAAFKQGLLAEINGLLTARGIPEAAELYELPGALVNLAYPLPGGATAKFLNDQNVYLGAQIASGEAGVCYGVVADGGILLISRYGENGANPELICYQKRG